MKKYIFYFLIIVISLTSILILSGTHKQDSNIDSLRFSNTMDWDPELLATAHSQTKYISDWQTKIFLDPPLSNSESENELSTLVAYKQQRTESKQLEIIKQINFNTSELGGHVISDYFDESKFPATSRLLKESLYDLDIITLAMKEKYDRVRPHLLEPDIEPTIIVPKHPAYPSGHSTQAHYLAYVIGELIPKKKESLIAEADTIALNREIAGVHYPSDSAAGVSLARQFWDLVLRDPEFMDLLKKARQEWRDML